MVTSEEVRDRMVRLTCSMSAATNSTRRSIDADGWLSKGTMTAKTGLLRGARVAPFGLPNDFVKGPETREHRNRIVERQGHDCREPHGKGATGVHELVRTNNAV